jgi:hypothetical protein
MPQEHIILKEQSAWTTWTTPDKAIPVDSWTLDPGIERVERRVTGQGRGLKYRWLGKKLPAGSFEMTAWWEYLGYFIKAAGLTGIANGAAGTGAYKHGFIRDDATLPFGLSVQAKRDGSSADNILGVVLNKLQFACQAGEPLVISGDYVAYDEAPTGGTWEAGTSAPAVIATPAYFADSILPFRFEHAELLLGPTLTWVSADKTYTKTGGTAYAIEMIEVALENNFDPRVFLGSRLAGNVIGQDAKVSGRFDLDQSTVSGTLRDAYRAGTQMALWLDFDSGVAASAGNNYRLTIIVPLLDFDKGALPDLSGGNDRRMQSVEFTGLLDSNAVDLAVSIVDKQATY